MLTRWILAWRLLTRRTDLSEAGKHFDPAVVDAFFAVQPEILETRSQFQNEQESRPIRLTGGTRETPP